MGESSKHKLVIIGISVVALSDMLHGMIGQLSQERRITTVSKILLANSGLEHFGYGDAKGSSVWEPGCSEDKEEKD